MASLTTMPNSPFWLARMRVWVAAPDHPQGGFWRQTIRSTKLPLKTARRTAQRVADEMEAVGRELRSETPDSVWAQSRLDALLRAAGMSAARRRSTWEKAAQGYLAAKTAKPRSMESYTKHISHFADFLGQRTRHDLRSITPDDISEFYHGMIKRGLSTRSAQQITKTIRAVFTRSMHLRNVEANPAALFRMTADHTPSGRKAFSQDEITAIFSVAEGEWRTACLFGLLYGMRLGDARRRTFEEIHAGNLQFLPQKKSRLGKLVTVPLMGELRTLRGKGPITPTLAAMEHGTASKHFSQLLDRAGITRVRTTKRGEGRGITDKTFHSFRHTTNSLLLEAGIDQRVRQLICDHDSVKMSNRYTAVSIDTMAKALAKAVKLPSSR